MLLDKIKSDYLEARKNSEKVKASILQVLIGECERIAKFATDQQIETVGRKMMKDLKVTMDKVESSKDEYNILSSYFPEVQVRDYKTVVTELLKEHSGNPISILGQVMKAGQGTYNVNEVKSYLTSL